MATIRLIPSIFYNAAGTSYLTVANQNNALTNTDSTTYATVSNINASTTSRYIYLQGFNWDDIPSGAVINSFSIKLKGYESGGSTSTSYRPVLCKGTSTYSNAYCDPLTATLATHSFSFTQDFDTFRDDGDDFGIRINCRRNSRNTAATHYIYGAEIEVNYTIPTPHTITTELTGNGTIVPSGSNTYYEGNEFNLTITPTDTTETVTASKNGADITEDLVVHYKTGPSTTDNRVLGTYALVSGGFNGSGASYFQGIVGKGHTGSTTTSNYYSSGSSTTAVFTYDMSFTLPEGAVVTNLYVMVNGHAESTSQGSEYMCARLISGSTNLSDELNFKSVGTSNSTQTITAHTMPTVAQAANLKLQCRLGYYGGAINGATCYIEYSIPTTEIDYYTYSYTIDGDATIEVNIGGGTVEKKIYYKNNGSWVAAAMVYKKINGSWVQQTNLTNVFDSNTNYVKG